MFDHMIGTQNFTLTSSNSKLVGSLRSGFGPWDLGYRAEFKSYQVHFDVIKRLNRLPNLRKATKRPTTEYTLMQDSSPGQ